MNSKTDKKDQIIASAQKLFALSGYDATTIRDICKDADVNVAMVNYYFGSKEGMFREMVEQKASFMRGKLEALLADKSLTSIEKIEIAIVNQVNRMFQHRSFTLVVIREMSKEKGNSLRAVLQELFLPNMKLLRNIIMEGIRSREFREVDVEMTISTILGSIWNIITSGDLVLTGLCSAQQVVDNPEQIQQRLIKHLHQLIRNHLLIEAHGNKS